MDFLHYTMVLVYSLEGSIGCGKSTILKHLSSQSLEWLHLMPEPVSAWQNWPSSTTPSVCYNFLDELYTHPSTFVFPFQCAALTKYAFNFKQLVEASSANDVILVERSFFTSVKVFARLLLSSDKEYTILESLASGFADLFPFLHQLDGIFFIDLPPEKCADRIGCRGRSEESDISVEYLNRLEMAYKHWQFDETFAPYNVGVVTNLDGMMSPEENVELIIESCLNHR